MAICENCQADVPDGLIHVPGEVQPGRVLREPTVHVPGQYEAGPDRGCNAVTRQQLHDYLAAHCENCGGMLLVGKHEPVEPGSCRILPRFRRGRAAPEGAADNAPPDPAQLIHFDEGGRLIEVGGRLEPVVLLPPGVASER